MDQLKQPPPSAADVKFDQEASKICTAAALKNRMAVDTLVATFTYGDVGRVYSEELVTDAKEIVALRALAIPVGRAPSFNLAILAQRKADVDLDAVNVVISQQPSSSPYKLTNSLQLALQAFGRGAATANQVWQSAGLPECGSNKNG
jgi:hypothetical protein